MSDIPPVPPFPPATPSESTFHAGGVTDGFKPRTILGMPKWVAVSLIVFVSLILVGVGSVVVVNAVSNHQLEVSAARESYQLSFDDYEEARDRLTDRLADAKQTLDSIEAKDLDDSSLLDELEMELEKAQVVAGKHEARAAFDPLGSSLDELSDEISGVDDVASELNTTAEVLGDADDEVRDDFESKAEAEAEKRAAEREAKAKDSAKSIAYEELFRSGDSLVGEYFKFEGEIIQDAGMGTYRVNITKKPGYSRTFWEDTVLLKVSSDTDTKLLEDDIITFTAKSEGTESYESIMGATIELPSLSAEGADVKLSGES